MELRLPYRPPLAGPEMLAYLRTRAVAGVEEVDDTVYRRALRLPHGDGTLEVDLGAPMPEAPPALIVRLNLDDARDRDAAIVRAQALFDLDADPQTIDAALAADPRLAPLVAERPGLRVPGTTDGAELAVRAVLGQQISLAGAVTAAARLVAAHGAPLRRPVGAVTHAFPTPEALAAADPASYRMPASRARALIALTAALAAGDVVLNPDSNLDGADTRRQLEQLPGIGPWTATYVAMRALRDRDAFLATDLGVRRALDARGLDGRRDGALRVAEPWRPYRAYGTMHLWAWLAAQTTRMATGMTTRASTPRHRRG